MADMTDDAFERAGDAADDSPRPGGDDHDQLMLVAVLATTMLLVGLALALDIATYTENPAACTTDTNLDGVVNHGGAVEAEAGILLDEVNREGGTYGELTGPFDEAFDNWSDAAATLAAVRGIATGAERVSHVRGTRTPQPDAAWNSTDGNEMADWTLANGVGARGVRFNVSRDSLSASNTPSFHPVVGDETNAVEIAVYRDSSRAFVAVEDVSGVETTCSVAADAGNHVTIDVADGRLSGTACDLLDAAHTDLDGSVTVSYWNTSEAEGSHKLYVSETNTAAFDAAEYEPMGSGSPPIAQEVLYAITVSYVYEPGEMYVSREPRAVSGEIA